MPQAIEPFDDGFQRPVVKAKRTSDTEISGDMMVGGIIRFGVVSITDARDDNYLPRIVSDRNPIGLLTARSPPVYIPGFLMDELVAGVFCKAKIPKLALNQCCRLGSDGFLKVEG
jgi:hypothetical protein